MSADYDRRRELAAWLRSRSEPIARSATEAFLDRHPDWLERYGDLAWTRGVEDAAFHVEFLAGAVLADDPGAFAAYARWTAGVLESRGMAPVFLAENLAQVAEAAARELAEPERGVVEGVVRAGIVALEEPEPARAAPAADDRFETERSLYVQAARSGQRRAALTVALEALRAGATVPDVYVGILQPAQYEIGRLWERNEITVATEHMATAITQYVVAHLYTRLELPAESRGKALVTGVRGELHQLGANMVADVLEADGWNMRFLGTQMPHEGVLQAIEEHEPVLVGISATILLNLPAVAELIEETRRRFDRDVRILVGGAAFGAGPEVWRDMGADGYGRDLRDAVTVAAELASGGR